MFMTGLIWFVQVVHYPAFLTVARAGPDALRTYAASHASRTTLVVAPVMLVEMATALLLLIIAFADQSAPASDVRGFRIGVSVGAVLIVAVWLSTFGVQVPLHGRIQATGETRFIDTLVATNWIRTVLWTARGLLSLALMRMAATPGA